MATRSKVALILDADLLVYSACTAVETSVEWSPGIWSVASSASEALGHFEAELRGLLEAIKETTPVDEVVLALSNYDSPAFRKVWMPSYKANRVGNRKPTAFFPLREMLQADYEVREVAGLEGDDVIGILLTDDRYRPGQRKIAASIDKDMLTLAGEHINWRRSHGPFTVTEEEAEYVHLYQTLTGDSVDGYKGCPGVGPVTARKILGEQCEHDNLWDAVVEAYEEAGQSEREALATARMARILRVQDYDFGNNKPIPWEPGGKHEEV